MILNTLAFVACALLFHLPLQVGAAADIDYESVVFEGGYVVGSTPTAINIETTHTQAVTGNIVYTFDTPLFSTSASGQAGSCSVTGVTATFSCAISANGMTVTATLATGSVPGGSTIVLSLTSPIAALSFGGEGAITLSSVTANSGADTLNGGAVAFCYIVNAPTITLTSADMNAGTQPTQLEITLKTAFAITAAQIAGGVGTGGYIQFAANKAVFVSGQSAGLTTSGVTFSSHATQTAQLTIAVFDSTTHAGGIAVDQTFTVTWPTSLLATLPNSAGAVTFTITVGPTHAMFSGLTGFGTIVASGGAGSVGSDPVANLGSVRRAFELPLYTLTPLLKSPDLVIHGSVFPGNETEQWFDRVVVATPDESRWMELRAKKDLEHLNISRVPDWMFSTLDVSLGYGSIAEPLAQTQLHSLGEKIPYSFLGQGIVFHKMHRGSNIRFPVVGGIRRECVDMAGTSLHLFICTAPAHEYYGPLHHLSLRYMHLDLSFVEVKDYDELTGLLPELWGTLPMTEATRAYVKEEKNQRPDEEFKKQGGNNCTAWVSDLDMEEIQKGFMEQNETLVVTV